MIENNDGWTENGGCFSPSSRYLYMMTTHEDIYQFDVSLPPTQIRSSIKKVTQGYRGQSDMQVSIDGKLYFIDLRNYPSGYTDPTGYNPFEPTNHYLSAINCPEQEGMAANVQDSVIHLFRRTAWNSLPIVNTSLLRNAFKLQADAVRDTICIGDSARLSAYGAGASVFQWQALSPVGSAGGLSSLSGSPVKASPPSTTLYRVVGFKTCELPDTAFVQLTVVPPPVAQAGPDQALCIFDSVLLGQSAPILTNRFRWSALPSTAGYPSPVSALSSPYAQRPVFRFFDTLSQTNTFRYVLEVYNGGCYAYDTVQVRVFPLPNPSGLAGPDTAICPHQSLRLGSVSAPTALSYAWSGTAGLGYLDSLSVAQPLFAQGNAWTADSSFVFVLQVTDSLGCRNRDTVLISLLSVPPITALPDTAFCSGDTLRLLADTSLMAGLGYSWSLLSGPPLLIDSLGSLSSLSGLNNSYTSLSSSLRLQVNDPLSGCLNRDTFEVLLPALPDTLLFGPKALCPNAALVPYTPQGTALSATFWQVSGGSIAPGSSLDTLRVNWGPADSTAFIRWQPLSRLGCPGDTVSTPILIRKELPTAKPTGDTLLCAPPPGSGPMVRTYSLPPNPNSTYQWLVAGADLLSGQGSPSIQIAIADTFQQAGFLSLQVLETSLTATDTCLGSSDTLKVFVRPSPAARVILSDGSRCANDSLVISLSNLNPLSTNTYQWSLSPIGLVNGVFSNNDSLWLFLKPSTTAANLLIQVRERNGFGCEGLLIDSLIPLLAQPIAQTGPDRSLCAGAVAVLGSASQSGTSYLWSPAAGLNNPGLAQPTFSQSNFSGLTQSITYTLSTQNLQGCRNRDSLVITLLPAPDSSSRILGDSLICAGLQEPYSLVPNPASVSWSLNPVGQGLGLISAGGNTVLGLASLGLLSPQQVELRAVPITAQGCRGDTLRNTISLFPKPRPQLSGDSIACEGNSSFAIQVTNPQLGSNYHWLVQQGQVSIGQGTASVEISFSAPYGNAQSRKVSLIETSQQGCVSDTVFKRILLDGSGAEILRATTLIQDEKQVEVLYRINNPSLTNQLNRNYELQRSVNLGPWQTVLNSTLAINRFSEATPTGYPQEAVQYRLRYSDACNVERQSSVHSLIRLNGSATEEPIDQAQSGYRPGTTALNWSPYGGWLQDVDERYDLYRSTTQAPASDFLHRQRVNPPWEEANGSDAFVQTYRVRASTQDEADTIRFSWSNSLTLRYQNPLKFFNLITPNGDGLNETFVISNVQLYEHRLTILDRWGRTVLQTDRYNNDWSTKVGGTYFYRLDNKSTGEQYSGWVMVVE